MKRNVSIIIIIISIVLITIGLGMGFLEKDESNDKKDKSNDKKDVVLNYRQTLNIVDGRNDDLINRIDIKDIQSIEVPAGKVLVVYNDEIIEILSSEGEVYNVNDKYEYYFVSILERIISCDSYIIINNIKYKYNLSVSYKINDPFKFLKKYYKKGTKENDVFKMELKEYIENNLNDKIVAYLDKDNKLKEEIKNALKNNETQLLYSYFRTLMMNVSRELKDEYDNSTNGLTITAMSLRNFEKKYS